MFGGVGLGARKWRIRDVDFQNIRYEKRDGVAVITLHRPERMNAFNLAMWQDLHAAVDDVVADEEVRVMMVTGAPRADGRPVFSAGVDVKARLEGQPTPNHLSRGWVDRVDELLKPSIAVIDGICTTGANEVALACDFRFVAETAQISDWHLKNLGLGIGGWGAAERLSRLVGVSNAKDILLTGRVIDGNEAYRMGYANRVYPAERLMEEAWKFAQMLVEKSPRGMAVTLSYLDQAAEMQKHQALRWADLIRELSGAETNLENIGRKLIAKSEGAAEPG
jgi:enoyl-CoA hydratase/carnithine racemase